MPEAQQRSGPRPAWSGTISFGLVSIPVSLFAANRSERLSLRTLSPAGTPLRREYYCPEDSRAVDRDDIVRGYEVSEGKYVTVSDEELESVAPEKSRDIDLRRFVPKAELSPMYFERAHFMVPASDSNKAYRLLVETLERTERAGIATFVMRGKEYLVAILAEDGLLRAETLRFADELRTATDIGLPELEKPNRAKVSELRRFLKKHLKKTLDPSELEDTALVRAREIIERKLKSKRDVVQIEQEQVEAEGRSADVIDLMAALKRSLAKNAGNTGKAEPATRLASTQSESVPDLEARSKQELYERAQALNIRGRSGMTKPELAKAIARSARRSTKTAS